MNRQPFVATFAQENSIIHRTPKGSIIPSADAYRAPCSFMEMLHAIFMVSATFGVPRNPRISDNVKVRWYWAKDNGYFVALDYVDLIILLGLRMDVANVPA